jgi:preprotein translocase subunit SecF
MLSLLGLFLMVGGAAGTLWILFWFLLNASSQVGTNLSKKIGTDNEHTDEYIATGKKFSKELQTKLLIRVGVTLVGFALYYFGGK